jgi:dUTPase
MSSESGAVPLHFLKLTEKTATTKSKAVLQFVRLTEKARPPTKRSPKSAGFDIRSAYDVIVPARNKVLINKDLKINFQRVVMVKLHRALG